MHFSDGEIQAVGLRLVAEGAKEIDGTGKYVTPGIIDNHSHMGVYPAPSVRTSSDGNEATNPVTSEVWAEHSVWTQDPQYKLALAGGITTFHVLPGSAEPGKTWKVVIPPANANLYCGSCVHTLCSAHTSEVTGLVASFPSLLVLTLGAGYTPICE